MSPELVPSAGEEEPGLPMPKVPQPAKPPENISPQLWQSENRDAILEFLAEINGTFLFYQVVKMRLSIICKFTYR